MENFQNTWKMDFISHLKLRSISEGIFLHETQLNQLWIHFEFLMQWNKIHNLTTIVNLSEAIEKHYLDCLKGFSVLTPERSCFDLGSGAGFPGLIGAVYWPNTMFTLIEASRKKCSFLSAVSAKMNLQNVKVENGRVENCHNIHFAISRATFSSNYLQLAASCLSKSGVLAIWENGSFIDGENKNIKLVSEFNCGFGEMQNRKIALLQLKPIVARETNLD